MCRADIALQELLAVVMMVHRVGFHLPGWVVALHLDNSPAEAYLCNQGGTVSPFLSWLACWILSLTDKHSNISYSSINSYQFHSGGQLSLLGSDASRMASSPSGGSSSFSPLESN